MLNIIAKRLKRQRIGSNLLKFTLLTLLSSCAGAVYAEDVDTVHNLSPAEKAKFVNAKFRPITKVKALPEKIAEDLGADGKDKNMSDVGENWASGCVGDANLPHQRLILAGTAGDRCLVYFERGGIAHFEVMRVYQFSDKTAKIVWEKHCNKRYANIDAIKQAISKDELN
jgi:hypothetical protein